MQQEQLLSSATIDGEIRIHCHRQLLFINKMLIEFDKVILNHLYIFTEECMLTLFILMFFSFLIVKNTVVWLKKLKQLAPILIW